MLALAARLSPLTPEIRGFPAPPCGGCGIDQQVRSGYPLHVTASRWQVKSDIARLGQRTFLYCAEPNLEHDTCAVWRGYETKR